VVHFKKIAMKIIFTLFIFCSLLVSPVSGQSKWYYTYGGEMLFSFADIDDNGQDVNSPMRWAPVINIQGYANRNISEKLGVYAGLAVRNVGYINDKYKDPTDNFDYKKKFRTYNLAIPIGIKIGNLSKLFFFGGYDIEFPFAYKEKTFTGGDKIDPKITGWFSDRYEPIQHGPHIGIQFPQGLDVKFKYYLSEFHNQDFAESTNGVQPYKGLESHIFYFSLSWKMFDPWW
jgi:hypothetical protein